MTATIIMSMTASLTIAQITTKIVAAAAMTKTMITPTTSITVVHSMTGIEDDQKDARRERKEIRGATE